MTRQTPELGQWFAPQVIRVLIASGIGAALTLAFAIAFHAGGGEWRSGIASSRSRSTNADVASVPVKGTEKGWTVKDESRIQLDEHFGRDGWRAMAYYGNANGWSAVPGQVPRYFLFGLWVITFCGAYALLRLVPRLRRQSCMESDLVNCASAIVPGTGLAIFIAGLIKHRTRGISPAGIPGIVCLVVSLVSNVPVPSGLLDRDRWTVWWNSVSPFNPRRAYLPTHEPVSGVGRVIWNAFDVLPGHIYGVLAVGCAAGVLLAYLAPRWDTALRKD